METDNGNVSLFEVIGFKHNNRSTALDPVKLVETIEPKEPQSPEDVIRKFNKQGHLNTRDAAVFATYFGIPEDPDLYNKWKRMKQWSRVVMVVNLIFKSGIVKFTKLV